MKSTAIILAGGKGLRLGSDIPKQFLKIKDKPILAITIDKFQKAKNIDEIIIVGIKEHISTIKEISEKFDKITNIVVGGSTRQESVYNGLVASKNEIVLIHDGVRPFIKVEEINELVKKTINKKAIIIANKSKDTIKIVENNIIVDTPNRDLLYNVQTPQCFYRDLILEAHKKANKDNFVGTDDASVVERLGVDIHIYEGSYDNIKITTDFDLKIANIL